MSLLRTIRNALAFVMRDAEAEATFDAAAFAGLIDTLSTYAGGPRQWLIDTSRTNSFCARSQAYFDLEQESA